MCTCKHVYTIWTCVKVYMVCLCMGLSADKYMVTREKPVRSFSAYCGYQMENWPQQRADLLLAINHLSLAQQLQNYVAKLFQNLIISLSRWNANLPMGDWVLVPIFSLTMSMAISKVRSDVAADCECSVTIGRKVLMSPPRWSHSVPLFTCMASRQVLHVRPISRLALQHSSRDFLQEKITFLCRVADWWD